MDIEIDDSVPCLWESRVILRRRVRVVVVRIELGDLRLPRVSVGPSQTRWLSRAHHSGIDGLVQADLAPDLNRGDGGIAPAETLVGVGRRIAMHESERHDEELEGTAEREAMPDEQVHSRSPNGQASLTRL